MHNMLINHRNLRTVFAKFKITNMWETTPLYLTNFITGYPFGAKYESALFCYYKKLQLASLYGESLLQENNVKRYA